MCNGKTVETIQYLCIVEIPWTLLIYYFFRIAWNIFFIIIYNEKTIENVKNETGGINMKILNSKLMSFEEECVEYFSEEEYLTDLDKRRKEGWTRIKRPNFETGCMEVMKKKTNHGFTVRYKRFNGIKFG